MTMKTTTVLLTVLSVSQAFTPSSWVSRRVDATHVQAASVDESPDDPSEPDADSPSNATNQRNLVMSKAIPFLECPRPLVDCDLAGKFGKGQKVVQ